MLLLFLLFNTLQSHDVRRASVWLGTFACAETAKLPPNKLTKDTQRTLLISAAAHQIEM